MQNKVKNILSNLKSVQEDLLALSDDLWLDIDHNDSEAMNKGVAFKNEFNTCNSEFTNAANNISELIQDYTKTPLYHEDKPEKDLQRISEKERIIKELNYKDPHSLHEDFKYKRPYGFVIQGSPYKNKVTWSELYLQLCSYLQSSNQSLFHSLDTDPDHISNRKNKYFSLNTSELRNSQKCGNSIYVEMNLSANQIRDSIKRLLKTFDVPTDQFTIYLREDRDA
jgi:hypothetical protein